jgi:poly-gamma-glutamate capsule biosynthesis protein CapA/YwtB (metallophosphatase superfamily)
LVLGHGPHVPRALEIVNDRLVAYSMGNFATYGRFSLAGPKGLSFVLDVSLDREGRFVAGKLLPTKLVRGGYPVIDEDGASIPLVASLSKEDFPTTGVVVDDDGTLYAQD